MIRKALSRLHGGRKASGIACRSPPESMVA